MTARRLRQSKTLREQRVGPQETEGLLDLALQQCVWAVGEDNHRSARARIADIDRDRRTAYRIARKYIAPVVEVSGTLVAQPEPPGPHRPVKWKKHQAHASVSVELVASILSV